MLRDTQKNKYHFLLLLLAFLIAIVHTAHADLTTLAKNDPFPMFTTLNLDDALLLTREQLLYKFDALNGWDYEWADKKRDNVIISVSPFAQNADRGKTIRGSECPVPTIPNFDCPSVDNVPLGDLTGRTDMIAVLYSDKIPAGRANFQDPSSAADFPVLHAASINLFPNGTGLNNAGNIDPDQQYGFFSFPLKYRKRGLRVQASGQLPFGLILQMQAGFANIRQTRENTLNLTNPATFHPQNETPVGDTGLNKPNVDDFLMLQLDDIMDELNIDFCDFMQTSLEDIRFNLYWRQFFAVNEDAESSWARFLAIPYFEVSGSFSPVKLNDHMIRTFFAVPFGNNRHTSAGLTAGVNLDFIETIEIGGEVGWTHFFKKSYCNMPVPTSEFQQNLYPYSTNVSITPGENWYFCARLAAYQFLDRLSMKFEWYVLDHQKDHIKVLECDPDKAFLPEVLECRSTFKVKLGNVAFNYDFSPNFNVGLLWQIPFSQRNAYRSSTIMASLNVTF